MKNSIIIFLLFNFLSLQGQHNEKITDSGSIIKKGIENIQSHLGKVPLFDASLQQVKEEVDEEMKREIRVPVPKDLAGGYTHERHKKNYATAQKAGVLYKILGEEKYAEYIKEMLLQYAKIYPDLPLHPAERSYARGKIFWQSLNDSNWLVAMSQAYDSIYEYLSEDERNYLEKDLFLPYANFLSIGNPKFFNRIHNHSTWGNAAVGMIGLVMKNDELVNRALYGLKETNIPENARDDDGGLILQEGQKAGFLANIEEAFSPSGYYTEGPYYQRYAMYPFMMFAKELENKRPEIGIFSYKDGVLIKAVYALLNLTDADGDFFPLNDAQKGMSLLNQSVVIAVDAAYYYGDQDPGLLSVAERQGKVSLDDAGMAVAMAIEQGKAEEFKKQSIDLTDGPQGNKGGVTVLRSEKADDVFSLVFKYTSQGDSHGHYDKLSFSFYNDGEEVIQDYGFARFVNIEPKNGGGYLKENTSWAKQSIAHNTITQNEKSHFNGDFDTGNKYHSEKYFSDFTKDNIQVVSAIEENAYPGTKLHRTLALLTNDIFQKPVVLDIFRIDGETENQYDLPFYYSGQIIATNFEYETPDELNKLGTGNGYQHLWTEAKGIAPGGNTRFNWSYNNRFYTLTQALKSNDSIILARIGASDPKFNLRRDPVYIARKKNTKNALFISILEPHGSYSPVTELGSNSFSQIEEIKVILDIDAYTGIEITGLQEKKIVFILSNEESSSSAKHQVKIKEKEFSWEGPYTIITK
ncbi:heparinase II/III family protein [Gramella sp. AN32]|uniref:Heparinase II/III family protein n=1 Tax=Christiangramia antarctica TaxID=2058158 RepID=A0ABW5X7W6_9FLAO|nr:heparinase II/III family protein [Gramella sp. AN32]MCM4155494.1 heparinase [Gramella sp. AN32]